MEYLRKQSLKLLILFLIVHGLISCSTSPNSTYQQAIVFPVYNATTEVEMILQDHSKRRIESIYSKLNNYWSDQPTIIIDIMKRRSVVASYLLESAIYYNDKKLFIRTVNYLIDNGIYSTVSSDVVHYFIHKYETNWNNLVLEVRRNY